MTRQVLVDAALLERVLPAKWPGAEVCRICCVRLSPGEKHLSSCPIPAIQAALAAPQPTPEREALELAAETLEESGGLDIDTRCHEQAAQGSAKLSVARYLRSLAGDPEPAP